MLSLLLERKTAQPLQILCLGAHSDDIEIGCGGTILRLLDEFTALNVYWVVFSADGARADEAQNSAKAFLDCAAEAKIVIKSYRDGFFPYDGADIKGYFEELKQEVEPDLIFTHFREDRHQDHRVISDLTWNTFRNHLILEYEVPKYDGDLGSPNLFVPLSKSICDSKVDLLQQHFDTQASKYWFSREVFLSLLALRGMESRAPDGYAEGYYARKLVI